jgi:hypothetical protein
MSVERRSEVIPASGRVEVGRGNLFILYSATAAVNLRLEARGTSEGFDNITGGVRVQRIQPWDFAIIIGAAGTTVVYIVGHENINEDLADVFLQVATIAGTVAVATSPASTITDSADVNAADAAQSLLFAANLLRRRITVHVDSANLGSAYFRTIGGANNIGEAQPGVTYSFEGTYGLDIRNDTGGVANFYIFEEG